MCHMGLSEYECHHYHVSWFNKDRLKQWKPFFHLQALRRLQSSLPRDVSERRLCHLRFTAIEYCNFPYYMVDLYVKHQFPKVTDGV